MSNFCLLNEAIDYGNHRNSINGMLYLVEIEGESEDAFYKNNSIYSTSLYEFLCTTYGNDEQIILKYLEQLSSTNSEINTEVLLNMSYPNEDNAFLGVNFSKTSIRKELWIENKEAYSKFKQTNLWKITFRNLWSKRVNLFPNLILCGEVQNQIARIGGSTYFNQIVERLKDFNSAIENWNTGNFNYKEINKTTSLRVSPESVQTMKNYGNERIFSMPNGGTETFELHIKTGDLRFHFYPDNNTRRVYIGYIGPHLSTVSN